MTMLLDAAVQGGSYCRSRASYLSWQAEGQAEGQAGGQAGGQVGGLAGSFPLLISHSPPDHHGTAPAFGDLPLGPRDPHLWKCHKANPGYFPSLLLTTKPRQLAIKFRYHNTYIL